MAYLPKFNAPSYVPQAQPGSAYRSWPEDLQPEHAFCFKHLRTVNNDNTISFDGKRLQIPPGPKRISYAHARVDLHQSLDGSPAICYKGETLVVYQPAAEEPVRVRKPSPATPLPDAPKPLPRPETPTPTPTPRKLYKPPPDHFGGVT